jgi:hypothetical protein
MSLWNETMDRLAALERDHETELTIDRKIAIETAYAVLSVAQEISSLNPRNVSERGDDEAIYDGWGHRNPKQEF